MKRSIVIVLFFLTTVVHAQLIKNYGIKIGLTSSNEKWDYTDVPLSDYKTDSKAGLNASAFAELFNLPYISILTEIGYDQKGMKQKIQKTTVTQPEGTGEYFTTTNRVDYLEFAVSLKFNYETPLLTPYVFAGPRYDVLIGSDAHLNFADIYDHFKKSVYGIKLGIGSEIGNILPYSLLAEFQYNYDLSEVYKTDNLKIENNSFELKIGIIF